LGLGLSLLRQKRRDIGVARPLAEIGRRGPCGGGTVLRAA